MGAITSPVKRYPGTVTLPESLSLPACVAYEEARQAVAPQLCPEAFRIRNKLAEAEEGKREAVLVELQEHLSTCFDSDKKPRCKPAVVGAAADKACVPAILACVSEWKLDGVPAKPTAATFPGSPRADSAALVAWLMKEIEALYVGEGLDEPDPNA